VFFPEQLFLNLMSDITDWG